MVKGIIGIDPGVRRLVTWMMVDALGKPVQAWHRNGGPAMRTFIQYLGHSANITRVQAQTAKENLITVLHEIAKEIVQRGATYQYGIGIERLPKGQETSGMTGLFNFEQAGVMSPAQAAFFLAPFQFFYDDLIAQCRRAGIQEPVLVEPFYNSTTCPVCWHVSRHSRSGDDFRCVKCRYPAQADENAAHMIGLLAWKVLSTGVMVPLEEDVRVAP